MIDIEDELYAEVSKAVRAKFNPIYMVGEYLDVPPKFPAVYFVEADNEELRSTQDSSNNENQARVMYEVHVFSNKKTGKKSECKKIMSVIDAEMTALNFSRLTCLPVSGEHDATIYEMVARYRATVDSDGIIYRG